LANRQTDKQTDVAEDIHLAPLCYTGGQSVGPARVSLQLLHIGVRGKDLRSRAGKRNMSVKKPIKRIHSRVQFYAATDKVTTADQP